MGAGVPVHDVDVEGLGPEGEYLLAVTEEVGEVCGEDGGADHALPHVSLSDNL